MERPQQELQRVDDRCVIIDDMDAGPGGSIGNSPEYGPFLSEGVLQRLECADAISKTIRDKYAIIPGNLFRIVI